MNQPTKPVKLEDFSQICRTCLGEECLTPIPGKIQNGIPLAEILAHFIPKEDLELDIFPQQICVRCMDFLNMYYSFKLSCNQSEAFLKTCLSQINLENLKPCSTSDCEETEVQESADDLPLIKKTLNRKTQFKRERRQIRKLRLKPKGKLKPEEQETHTCKECNKTFRYRYKLNMHLKVHTKEKPFKCDICPLSFGLKCNLRRHEMLHSGIRPHICEICGKGFIQAPSLQRHLKNHNLPPVEKITCKICNRIFVKQACYDTHMKKQHSTSLEEEDALNMDGDEPTVPSKEEYKCEICGRTFGKLIYLKRHEPRHGEKKFLCTECGKGFVRKADLQSHVKVHTGEKPHKCDICSKSFAHAGSLATHSLVHSGFKPYSCYVCTKQFSQLSHLKIHQRTHNGERPYSCSYCGKTFALNGNLTVHIRTHTGETPFVCDVCGKGFYDSSSLKKHQSSHLNLLEGKVKVEASLIRLNS